MKEVPVTIIAGYLGSGKTTMVNALLRRAAGRRVAVLVNDFGDINIDADLIEATDDDIVRLVGGCACCRIGNNLASALSKVIASTRYDHVLVEASGVAQPGRLAQVIPFVPGSVAAGLIVVCDATTLESRLTDPFVGDLVQQQIAEAGLLILNKLDLVSAASAESCERALRSWNSNVAMLKTTLGRIEWSQITPTLAHTNSSGKVATERFKTTVFKGSDPVEAGELRNKIAQKGLARVKGYVELVHGKRAYVEMAGDVWTWPDENEKIQMFEILCIYSILHDRFRKA